MPHTELPQLYKSPFRAFRKLRYLFILLITSKISNIVTLAFPYFSIFSRSSILILPNIATKDSNDCNFILLPWNSLKLQKCNKFPRGCVTKSVTNFCIFLYFSVSLITFCPKSATWFDINSNSK